MGVRFNTDTNTAQQKASKSNLSDVMNKDISLFGSSFSNKKKESFYSRLSILLKSGINLNKCLELIAESQKKEKDQEFITTISKEIVSGQPLHLAMQNHSQFTSYEYNAVKIGEQTGKLFEITSDLFHFYKQKNEQKRQVYSALSYPIVILVTAIVIVYFMMRFVVPMFEDIFKQQKVELPWITQVVVDISAFVKSYGLLLVLGFIALPFAHKALKKQEWYAKIIDQLKIRIPIVGNYIRKVYVAQFVQAMALLTGARVPMTQALDLVRNMILFHPLQHSLKDVESRFIEGEKLSESFARHSIYDKDMIALLKVAEETNKTEFIFEKLHEQYSSELKYSSQIITSLLNPIFILFIAIIVGVILISMYLPMFELSTIIG